MTSSSSPSVSSSVSSSSSRASSIANGVRSINAAAFAAAWNIPGMGEYPDGDIAISLRGTLRPAGADLADGMVMLGDELEPDPLSPLRLAFDAERRIVGVSSDSRALGSSSAVNLPIAGAI